MKPKTQRNTKSMKATSYNPTESGPSPMDLPV